MIEWAWLILSYLPDLPNLTNTDCQRPIWLDVIIWVGSGGFLTSMMQIISEKAGNKQLKEAYKRISLENQNLKRKLDILFDRKETYKDTVLIIKSKLELYQKMMVHSVLHPSEVEKNSCQPLVAELAEVIDKVIKDGKAGETSDNTFSIDQKRT